MKLALHNITKQFPQATAPAIEDVSFAVQPGEFLCLVGSSGCGKSTLLNLIAGLDKPTGGTIEREGKVGFMFQEPALFPWLTVFDNIAFGLRRAGEDKATIQEKVQHYLTMVHLERYATYYPHALSGGMKQRTALARTLITDPDILLMDEPFGALDAQTRDHLHDELQNIWLSTKKTIVFVTHDIREAVVLGDRVIVMASYPGRIHKEYVIHAKHPRDVDSAAVSEFSQQIRKDLFDVRYEGNA